MDARAIILVMAVVFTNVQGYTKADLEAKLQDARNYLNNDAITQTLTTFITDSEKYLSFATTSNATKCIYAKSKWYLKTYFDPLMAGYVQRESRLISKLDDMVDDADYSDKAAIAQLYQQTVAIKTTIENDLSTLLAYMAVTIQIRDYKYDDCLALK